MPYSKQDKQPQFDVTYGNLIVHKQIKGTTVLQVTLPRCCKQGGKVMLVMQCTVTCGPGDGYFC